MSTALAITKTDAIKAIHKAQRLDSLIARGKENQDELVNGAVRTVVGSGAALGLGLLQGAGHGELWNIPVTLGTGVTAHGLRLAAIFFGSKTLLKASEPLATIGDVGLWTYLYATGVGMGSEHWGKGKGGTHGTMGGDFADQLRAIANG